MGDQEYQSTEPHTPLEALGPERETGTGPERALQRERERDLEMETGPESTGLDRLEHRRE